VAAGERGKDGPEREAQGRGGFVFLLKSFLPYFILETCFSKQI
jgi:hypothetical protein